ncbi:MAG: PD-(D/E)XK motif protein [Roseiarcus sp.]
MMTLFDAWSALMAEGRTEPGWHARRVCSGSLCDVRAAVRSPDRAEAVLFEVSSRALPPWIDAPDCVGFELGVESVISGPNGKVRLCLVLRDRRYHDIFGALAEDVVRVVSGADSEQHAVKLLIGRLNTWRRFISQFGPEWLTEERQLGLFAELRFLRDEVIPLLPAGAAVRCWQGPYLRPQDFRFRAAAVEVKATASRNPSTFPVSNLDQLDPGGLDALLLFHVSLEVGSDGETLPQTVQAVRASLLASDPAAAADFDASLIEAGYLDIHAVHYERALRVCDVRWMAVRDAFPRLTGSSVPSGVTSATYSVSLEACGPFILDADAARKILEAGL